MDVDEIGPSLKYATADVTKVKKGEGGKGGGKPSGKSESKGESKPASKESVESGSDDWDF